MFTPISIGISTIGAIIMGGLGAFFHLQRQEGKRNVDWLKTAYLWERTIVVTWIFNVVLAIFYAARDTKVKSADKKQIWKERI